MRSKCVGAHSRLDNLIDCRNLVAIPTAPARAAAGGTTGTSAEAARRVKAGLLERLFQDNVMDLLLLLAQHAQQVGTAMLCCAVLCCVVSGQCDGPAAAAAGAARTAGRCCAVLCCALLFQDNVMDVLLLLAQHAQQVSGDGLLCCGVALGDMHSVLVLYGCCCRCC